MESTEITSPTERSDVSTGKPGGAPLSAPWWIRIVPFFLSAFFFLSALFALFAPLPLLLLRFRSGRALTWLAVVTNAVIVGVVAGRVSLLIYAVFVGTLALSLSEFIQLKRSAEKTVLLTLLCMCVAGALVISWYAHLHHVTPLEEGRQLVAKMVEYLGSSISQGEFVNPGELDEWKQDLRIQFPSAILVFSLVMVWANFATLLRANPAAIREKMGLDAAFLRTWKAPELLVWPTLLCGVFLVVDMGRASDVALGFFRLFMAIYAIQGLSILSFFFEAWGINGFFRVLGFVASVLLMMPLLLSLGFFDLWFDFRSKFRQS